MSAPLDAALVASLFAVDPCGLGGVCLRSLAQPARTQWLQMLRELLPDDGPMHRVPFNIADGRLLGGLDLVATLRSNRPVAERGILAAADGGVVVLTMAERLTSHTAALLNSVLDAGRVALQREGVDVANDARIGVVALDESMADDERVPASLLDRMAFLVDLNGYDLRTLMGRGHEPHEIVAARRILPSVTVPADVLTALCATGMALGAGSPRVALLALRAAQSLAALDGRTRVEVDDAAIAARLVFAPRATQMPADPAQPAEPQPAEPQPAEQPPPEQPADRQAPDPPAQPPEPGGQAQGDQAEAQVPPNASPPTGTLQDQVLAAAMAAVPAGLLAGLRAESRSGAAAAGRAGAFRTGGTRGRPAGVRAGAPQGRSRLNLMETLRAAAPWQRLRGRLGDGRVGSGDGRVRIDPSDFRITRFRQRSPTLTIFAVDASGSSALNRLAEAKGAVELLLADCYVRRDQVAVVSFRGRGAELLLPPTRSLVRAKRSLAGLPGGGGTPLAAGIECAMLLALQAQRRGETPTVVLLSDGRANVSRDGVGGRERAHAEALQTGRVLRRALFAVLFVDTSPRPNSQARDLAAAMNARYIPLPFANARAVSSVVTAAAGRQVR